MSGIPRLIRSSKRTRLSLYPCCIFLLGMHTNAEVLCIFVRLASWLSMPWSQFTPRGVRDRYTPCYVGTRALYVDSYAHDGMTDKTVHSVSLGSSHDRSNNRILVEFRHRVDETFASNLIVRLRN